MKRPEFFEETQSKLFFTRNDPRDRRLGEFARESSKIDVAVLGYPDDEGIKLNSGRPGAALAPDAIRKHLYKMTPKSDRPTPSLYDLGNLKTESNLKQRHDNAEHTVEQCLQEGHRVLTLGGGHDYGYPDFSAFIKYAQKMKLRPFIINFDAHLDVRPDDKHPHSGTAFYRLLTNYAGLFDFYEVGIQDWCNAAAHLEWAKTKNTSIVLLDDILGSAKSLLEILQSQVLGRLGKNHILALSVDIDFFSLTAASQSFPIGVEPSRFLSAWQFITTQLHPKMMGVYEVSPPFDVDGQTSKLAAILAYHFIFQ